jgi:hypothetical protein
MNEDKFWAILENIWVPRKPADSLRPRQKLEQILEKLPIEELLGFETMYCDYQNSLLLPAHLCAVFLINGGILGNEAFLVYSEAIVAAPRAVFLKARASPDRILAHSMYAPLLRYDSSPYASVAPSVGMRRFEDAWIRESRNPCWRVDPINIDKVRLGDQRGSDIVDRDLCRKLVPKLYETLGERCDWSHDR